MKKTLFTICLLVGFSFLFAQEDVTQIQPTIMVVPWSSEGEDLRTKLENDFNYRTAIQVISNAFSKRGFSTKDFVTQLENTLNDQVISESKMNQSDLFKKVIEMSPTDYYIETEVKMVPSSSGNKVKIIMNAIDKYTGDKIAAEPMSSQPFHTDDWPKLTEKALEDGGKLESFFGLLNMEFDKIRKTGRTITIKIEVDGGSAHALDEEVGDDYDLLSDLIIQWVKSNAYKNYARTKGNTSSLLYFDEVKIPLRDENGSNYDINTFATAMYKFLRRTGKQTDSGNISVKKDIKGLNILFTLSD